MPLPLQQVNAHLLVEEVVLDQENAQRLGRMLTIDRGSSVRLGIRERIESRRLHRARHGDGEREGAPLADLAPHVDTAAHDLDEPGGDAQPQAGAAVFLAQRAIGLDKRIENGPEFVRRDADAGVADVKMQPDFRRTGCQPVPLAGQAGSLSYGDENFALVGELDGVAGQVEQHLAQADGISQEQVGRVSGDSALPAQALAGCTESQRLEGFFHLLAQ